MLFAYASFAQTPASLEWVLLDDNGVMNGTCISQSDCDEQLFCYGLQYTPGTSGTLTSYTTQFSITCAGPGNTFPVISNQSCRMTTGNDNIFNACSTLDVTYFQSNGNGGSFVVTELVPVILHQICLSLQPGETVIINSFPGEYTASYEPPDPPELLTYNTTSINSNDACLLLPITWLSFSAYRHGELQSMLQWSTSDEINNSHFIIERSVDHGKNFLQIGRVQANGSANHINHYYFIDNDCSTGSNLYRIIQVDFDGNSDLSEIREVRFNEPNFKIHLSPNPAKSKLSVELYPMEAAGTIRFFNTIGQMLLEVTQEPGHHLFEIDVSHLNPGYYSVLVEHNGIRHVEKLIIVR